MNIAHHLVFHLFRQVMKRVRLLQYVHRKFHMDLITTDFMKESKTTPYRIVGGLTQQKILQKHLIIMKSSNSGKILPNTQPTCATTLPMFASNNTDLIMHMKA